MILHGKKPQNKKAVIYYCFIINILLGFIAFLPCLVQEQGMLSLGTDYDNIVMPLWENARKAIWRGEFSWSWSFDLGTDFVGANSFMALGSPFFWITVLFRNINYLYLGAGLFILKYGVAGFTSALYFSRFCNDKKSILLGSVLYAFSGFQAINLMFGCFHDVVALFPLLLYGLERLMKDKKHAVFALCVFMNAFVNYYFFVGEVIFLIIYYLVRFLPDKERRIQKILQCICEGILGIGMAAVCFFPSVMFILQNPRSSEAFSISKYLNINFNEILRLVRTFLFPGEMMQQWSCVYERDWTSSSAYLPMIGMIFVLCFLFTKTGEWNWLKRLAVICIVFMCIPLLNSVFTMMTDSYCRWFYMPILIFSLISAKVLEEHEKYSILPATVFMLVIVMIAIIGFQLWDKYIWKVIFISKDYWLINSIAIVGIVLLLLFCLTLKKKEVFSTVLVLCVCAFAVGITMYTIYRYQSIREYDAEYFANKQAALNELGEDVDKIHFPYRLGSIDNVTISSVDLNGSGSSFSNVQKSIFDFWSSLGEKRRVVCPEITPELYDYVGARYYIRWEELTDDDYTLLRKQNVKDSDRVYYLYDKKDVHTIGLTYLYYMNASDFLQLQKEEKIQVIQKAIIINASLENEVEGFLQKYSSDCEEIPQQDISNYSRNRNGFTCSIDITDDSALMVKIPFSKFWNCYVNGKKTEVFESNGFSVLFLRPGENNIKFSYFNWDVLIGFIITICSWGIWIFYRRTRRGQMHA